MRFWLCRAAVLAVLASAAGCLLTFDDDAGDDVVCTPGRGPEPIELRDPSTGVCQAFSGGAGGGCGDDQPATERWPDWAFCYRGCEGLDESTCQTTPGCRAAYLLPWDAVPCLPGSACPVPAPIFRECWGVAQTGPVHGSCDGLDAHQCSQHDDCAAFYLSTDPDNYGGRLAFANCGPENAPPPDTCDSARCMPGSHCEEQCFPPPSPCDEIPGGHTCEMTGCQPVCVPDQNDPGSCTGPVYCDAAPPACPVGTVPGISNGCWSGYCIPRDECAHDPGHCYGEVACDALPPACPPGTEPGIRGACWSGYCIPQSACEPQSCESVTTERACQARMECIAVYEGSNCTCYPDGTCTCEDRRFARCSTRGIPIP